MRSRRTLASIASRALPLLLATIAFLAVGCSRDSESGAIGDFDTGPFITDSQGRAVWTRAPRSAMEQAAGARASWGGGASVPTPRARPALRRRGYRA